MNSSEVRKKYLDFFKSRGHVQIPSSKLVPENDPTTLFTGSGMQPLIPYLLGESHPLGKRLVDSQRCFRAQDIEEVGDNRHDTFFEMLGNWSLGDYFKKDQITWIWEFLTKELKLDPQKLYVTSFEGNDQVPKDEETVRIWKDLGINDDHIFFYNAHKNWWSRSGTPEQMPEGEIGGPDSEIFFEFTEIIHDPKFGSECHPNCDCGRFLEIGNSVFIQYKKTSLGKLEELPQKNVDFGGGLERFLMAANNEPDMFKNDLHWGIIQKLQEQLAIQYNQDEKTKLAMRIIADHIKAAVFLIKDGIIPSNKLQGYVLRRLLRRAAVKLESLKGQSMQVLPKLVDPILDIYSETDYFQIGDWDQIRAIIEEEINKFEKTLLKGLKEIEKLDKVDAKTAFNLYQTFGFPLEITAEILKEKGQEIDLEDFQKEFEKHQELSRTTSAGQFKGGLADQTEATTKLHTANHLLQAALKKIIGNHLGQRGSNITAERLRFDFNHDQKLTDEQIKEVEDLVNQQIQADLPVHFDIEDRDEAIKEGALTNHGENYPEKVKVYKIGHPATSLRGVQPTKQSLSIKDSGQARMTTDEDYFSKELCGGPHVDHTGVLNKFKILKQESAGAGIRRIYATVLD